MRKLQALFVALLQHGKQESGLIAEVMPSVFPWMRFLPTAATMPWAGGGSWRTRRRTTCASPGRSCGTVLSPKRRPAAITHFGARGRVLPRWQVEVTGGDRVWYLLDAEKHTVWVEYAGAHPKATE